MSAFIDPAEKLPDMKPGLLSAAVLVITQEWGRVPSRAIACCWKSSAPGQKPQWYLDQGFYRLDSPVSIAADVIYWAPLPELDAAQIAKLNGRLF